MIDDLSLDEFRKRNRIQDDTWTKSNCEWKWLQEIGKDHESNSVNLGRSAGLSARVIQNFKSVHSVRWRVKDAEHLLEKIVRKRAEGAQKYLDLTLDNYFEVVGDLVGVRALHLFKDDCFDIDADLKSVSKIFEKPVAYIRDGDQGEVTKRFTESGFDIQVHRAGYRSIHYVVESQPLKRKVYTEIQVRTIFEEGWSEIDHSVRYPNFSEDKLVDYFLTIFNRMAGSADEMGGFVRNLAVHLKAFNAQVNTANLEKEEAVRSMQKLVTDLQKAKKDDLESRGKLELLSVELEKLKRANDASGLQTYLPYFAKPLVMPELFNIAQSMKEAEEARGLALGDFFKSQSAPIPYSASPLVFDTGAKPMFSAVKTLLGDESLRPQIRQAEPADKKAAIPPADKSKDKK